MPVKEYKEGSKTFYSARFCYYKNGEKIEKYKKGFTGKKKAEDWAINTKRKLQGLQAGADNIKVNEHLKNWLDKKEGKVSPTTYSGYSVNVDHINNYIGNMTLSKINLTNIQNMLDELTKSGLKHRTVKYIHATLHAAFEYAVKADLIIKNVSEGVEIAEDETKFSASILTAKDVAILLFKLREQNHPIYPCVLLAVMRGLRRGECLGLTWNDIDFKTGVAHIVNNYVVVNKIEYHKKVKTKESERLIDISGFVFDELKALKKRNQKDGIIQTYVCEIDGKLPEPSHISRSLKQFQKANNLPECRFHDLRHTFAMLQLESHTDLDTLKRLMGHSKISVTSDNYLKQSMSLMKKASTNFDNVIELNYDKITTNNKNPKEKVKRYKIMKDMKRLYANDLQKYEKV